MEKKLTLLELNKSIQVAVKNALPDPVWIVAEIHECRVNRNGHCYLELIQKDETEDKIVAKASAIIWSYTYRMLKPYFETAAGLPLSEGIKVFIKVLVEFHEVYGISLTIQDIDPSYTLGDLAMKKLEVIRKLEEQGVINMNKELPEPLAFQKIAVISSPTAAGYGDFIEQLKNNTFGFVFYCKLFPATMQGDSAAASVIDALDRIFKYESFFDCVVIIRGGGASADLHCFNDYLLAMNIAQFPLPVITGIGHERDETIADRVAFAALKTPTAVAEFLVHKLYNVQQLLVSCSDNLMSVVSGLLQEENMLLQELKHKAVLAYTQHISVKQNQVQYLQKKLENVVNTEMRRQSTKLIEYKKVIPKLLQQAIRSEVLKMRYIRNNLRKAVTRMIEISYGKVELAEHKIQLQDPLLVLKKGYSITTQRGKVIKNSNDLNNDEPINIQFYKGNINVKLDKSK